LIAAILSEKNRKRTVVFHRISNGGLAKTILQMTSQGGSPKS